MNIFEKFESNVRAYCRNFPVVFSKAKDSYIYSEDGKEYIDFFAGAGALNYGHNNNYIKQSLLDHIRSDKINHALDMYTVEKKLFINTFYNKILKPKNFNYKLQFCGPTGTNAVEAALKLSRKIKSRQNIFSFMGAFHGMTIGSLAASSNKESRSGSGLALHNVNFMPYPSEFMKDQQTLTYLEHVIKDTHSGIEKPAAIILETVQAEGGINIAPIKWLQSLREICYKNDILLVCDEIQVGCYRTGHFFSFERADITPDIVLLSKSLSGYGIPFSLVLIKPDLDIWKPGEHNGTFRGNQMAFVTAASTLNYIEDYNIKEQVAKKSNIIETYLENEIKPIVPHIKIRGIGLIWGIDFTYYGEKIAKSIVETCFKNGLLIERSGRNDIVVKLMPPLNIETDVLIKGLTIIKNTIQANNNTNTNTYSISSSDDEKAML